MKSFLNSSSVIRVFIISLIYLLLSCSSTKNLPPKPAWLLSRPITPGYYIGIGSAPIGLKPDEYRQSAKRSALNDLAGEISMGISNTSFLHTLEVNNKSNETYDSRTQTTITEDLEGYTQEAEFQDKNTYWVYYSLSKSTYEQLKQQKIQKSLDNALAKFTTARQMKSQGDLYHAILMLVKATDDIKPYLSEPLQTSFEGREIFFGNELFNEILSCLSDLKINAVQQEVKVKRGQAIQGRSLSFQLTSRNGKLLEGFPVVGEFSSGGLIVDKARTQADGMASFSIPKVKSVKPVETFSAKPDINALLQEATNDFSIRKLLKNFTTEKASVQILVQSPVFYIETSSVGAENELMLQQCRESLRASAVEITDAAATADFRLVIQTVIRNANAAGTILEVQANVFNRDGKNVYQRSTGKIESNLPNPQKAYDEILSKGKDYMKNRVIPDILGQLF